MHLVKLNHQYLDHILGLNQTVTKTQWIDKIYAADPRTALTKITVPKLA